MTKRYFLPFYLLFRLLLERIARYYSQFHPSVFRFTLFGRIIGNGLIFTIPFRGQSALVDTLGNQIIGYRSGAFFGKIHIIVVGTGTVSMPFYQHVGLWIFL